jgi:hypothetical protein
VDFPMKCKLGGSTAAEQFVDASDDFTDANGAIEHGVDRRQGDAFASRGDQDGGHAPNEGLDDVIACDLGGRFKNDHSRHLSRGDGTACVVNEFHAKRVDAAFAEFGTNTGAQGPIASDDENGWHLATTPGHISRAPGLSAFPQDSIG